MIGEAASSNLKFMFLLPPVVSFHLDKLSKCKDCVHESLVWRLALSETLKILLLRMLLLLVVSQVVTVINLAVLLLPSQVNLKDEIIQFSYWISRESENGKDK